MSGRLRRERSRVSASTLVAALLGSRFQPATTLLAGEGPAVGQGVFGPLSRAREAWPGFHVTMTSGGSFSRSSTWARPSPRPRKDSTIPQREHDACGVGFVADLKGRPSHKIVEHGLQILENLTHRGAAGRRPAGRRRRRHPGANPARLSSSRSARRSGSSCRSPAITPSATCSCRAIARSAFIAKSVVERVVEAEGLKLLGWRDVPVDNSCLAASVIETEPTHRQVLHRPRARHRGRGRLRAQALRPAQGDLQHHQRRHRRPRHRLLHRVAVLPHARLQGHVPRLPARRLLSRPAPSAVHLGAGARASALLDQHLPVLEARPPLPHGRP